MKLHLIRHAKTRANANGFLSCETEEPLNQEGFQQASLLAKYIATIQFDKIWCSPLLRAIQTLAPFIESARFTPEYWPLLCEGQLNFNALAPISTPEFSKESNLPKASESVGSFRGRVSEFLSMIANENTDKIVICITHGHFIREALNLFLGASNYTRFPVGNCSDTLIELGEHQFIHYVNRTTI
ncbi:phosphoglycerate mutase [Lentisphaera araneosa HTCC2155]|uniref:Phosphoglycerate mutase n=1 Tax=Lentisphaera araneosa HTCC2155 TaxID=313628 RepID=A6DM02_9BACT|nr:histidine phosphatase family protein [Lentisphaera araneosa]EDM27300.1 phosphoglycerate mutase [Lentisphaera araneosa HTCC2155]